MAVYQQRLESLDPRLGRHIFHDDRSKAFPAAQGAVPSAPVYHQHHGATLNQKSTGSCTASSFYQCLVTGLLWRKGFTASQTKALALYHDETVVQGGPVYPPNDPGGSGLAVCKAGQQDGLISSYTHAFGLDHALTVISSTPFITGVPWYDGMFQVDPSGQIRIGGLVAGGHEFLILGYDPNADRWWALNSWGKKWGVALPESKVSGGAFWMDSATFSRLLNEQGDITVPIR